LRKSLESNLPKRDWYGTPVIYREGERKKGIMPSYIEGDLTVSVMTNILAGNYALREPTREKLFIGPELRVYCVVFGLSANVGISSTKALTLESPPLTRANSQLGRLLGIMGCWPKLRHKVVLAIIGCGAHLSSSLSLLVFSQ